MNEKLKKMFQEMLAAFETAKCKLPDGLQAEFDAIKAKLNSVLESMKPLDAVPAAMDAASSLNWLQSGLERMLEAWTENSKRLSALADEMASRAPSLNRLGEIEEQIKSGKLIPEATHNDLVKSACEAAVATALDNASKAQALLSARRTDLAKCGLPEPQDEKVLGLPDAEWEARKATAAKRKPEMESRGIISTNGLFPEAVWADDEKYGQIDRWTKAAAASAASAQPGVPGGAVGTGARAYAGGTGGSGEQRRVLPV